MTLGFTALELARIQFASRYHFISIFPCDFYWAGKFSCCFGMAMASEQTILFIMTYSNSG